MDVARVSPISACALTSVIVGACASMPFHRSPCKLQRKLPEEQMVGENTMLKHGNDGAHAAAAVRRQSSAKSHVVVLLITTETSDWLGYVSSSHHISWQNPGLLACMSD